MQIKNSFTVPLPADRAWETLLDIPYIAPCMPGARLTGSEGEDVHDGEVAVRLGPVLLTFKGRAQFVEKDAAAKRATVKAQGRDVKGRGNASANVLFALAEEGERTRVDITTDLNLTGAVAQYGRGAGMITDLSNHLIGEFARNLEAKLESEGAAAPAAVSSQPAASEGDAEGAAPEAAGSERDEPAPAAAALSGFTLIKVLVRGFFQRLFGRRSGTH